MEIRVERVSYAYPDGTRALAEISLSLRQGECAALVGTNGAGKTTLVRHLNGLLKPGSGDVWVGEWNTRARTVAFLSRWVGYAYQNPDDQLFCSKVWDEVAFGPRNLRLGAGQIDRQVRQALSLTGLEGKEQVNPFDLSWPWRRRVALASILAMNPQFLILDEPTAGQDPAGVELMAEVIRASRAAGKGVLAITHDMDFCAENFERLIVLKQGRLVFDGEMGAALVNPGVFREAGLGEPQVQQVGRALALEGPMPTMDAFLEAYRAWKTL